MRLITFQYKDQEKLGAWIADDEKTLDLHLAAKQLEPEHAGSFTTMQGLIEAGESSWDLARCLIDQAPEEAILDSRDLRILAPIRPLQLRDFLCFEEHLINAFTTAKEARIASSDDPDKTRAELEQSDLFDIPQVWYQYPIYYNCSRMAVCGPDTEIHWPEYSKMMDYELEFAAVIGKKGRDITRDKASQYIFGYTVFNDFSARDEQMLVMEGKLGPGKGKDFDNANVLGPCIVTADEIPNVYDLTMTARVNDEEWSHGSTSTMHYKFEDIIAYISRSETIYPGEVFGSGTVGSGCGIEHMRFLQSGDVVELEVQGIGKLRNGVFS